MKPTISYSYRLDTLTKMATRLARQAFPAAAAAVWQTLPSSHTLSTHCDSSTTAAGFDSNEEGDYHGLFPKRQLWKPQVEYPLWDANWDGRMAKTTGDEDRDRLLKRQLRKEGVTRHIILVRHGQYTENEILDKKKKLTLLGRQQADLTGKRLKEIIEGVEGTDFDGCNIKILRVSDLERAKETSAIIANHLNGVERAIPDPELNEGRPSHNLPAGNRYVSKSTIEKTDEQHSRIEKAYRKYFYRAEETNIKIPNKSEHDGTGDEDSKSTENQSKHEFEIIVCHANVIRYFVCRALQIPPEAWLRLCTFNCSLTYLTIRPTGTVSCRMLGGK